MPTTQRRIVVFSQLSHQQKQKYLDFLCHSQPTFQRSKSGQEYVATIQMVMPEDSGLTSTATPDIAVPESKGNLDTKEPSLADSEKQIIERYHDVFHHISEQPPPSSFTNIRSLAWLLKIIHEIYDDQLEFTTAASFSERVVEFFKTRYDVKALVAGHCWELMLTLEKFRPIRLEARVFGLFLDGTYDCEDVLFFFDVQSTLARECDNSPRQGQARLLSSSQCQSLARAIFGNPTDPMFVQFMVNILSIFEGQSQHVDQITFTCFALQVYHNSRIEQHLRLASEEVAVRGGDENENRIDERAATVSEQRSTIVHYDSTNDTTILYQNQMLDVDSVLSYIDEDTLVKQAEAEYLLYLERQT